MRLLLDIDDRLFREVKKFTKAKKKKDAIVIPMEEYLARRKRMELADLVGKFDIGMTLSDLKEARKEWG